MEVSVLWDIEVEAHTIYMRCDKIMVNGYSKRNVFLQSRCNTYIYFTLSNYRHCERSELKIVGRSYRGKERAQWLLLCTLMYVNSHILLSHLTQSSIQQNVCY
jgi:hypothetical protein